jgi:hypothetical protein
MFYSYEAFRLMHEDFVTTPPTNPYGPVRRSGSARFPAGPTNRARRWRRR